MKLNIKKVIKLAVVLLFAIYFIVTVYNQQKELDAYKRNIAYFQ